jgi:hypothetical protein
MRIEPGMVFKERHSVSRVDLSTYFSQREASQEEMDSAIYYYIDHIDHKKKEVYFNVYYPKYRTDYESKSATHHSVRRTILAGVWIRVPEEEFVAMRAKHLLTYA